MDMKSGFLVRHRYVKNTKIPMLAEQWMCQSIQLVTGIGGNAALNAHNVVLRSEYFDRARV